MVRILLSPIKEFSKIKSFTYFATYNTYLFIPSWSTRNTSNVNDQSWCEDLDWGKEINKLNNYSWEENRIDEIKKIIEEIEDTCEPRINNISKVDEVSKALEISVEEKRWSFLNDDQRKYNLGRIL